MKATTRKAHHRPTIAVIATIGLGAVSPSYADQFLNFGQMGAPNSVAFEAYPSVTRTAGETSFYSNNILAYFSETGFTGTGRDQFEVWAGAAAGYSDADPNGKGSSWGVSNPNIGFEYYYNIIEPKKCADCEYSIYTISPLFSVTFPTGSSDNTGFRAGSNNYAYYFGMSHFLKFGRWSASINPVAVSYSAESKNYTNMGGGQFDKLQGGISYTVADIATGYDVTPDLSLGVHHAYRFNNQSDSDFDSSRQGFIGPAVSYSGFSKDGLYLMGNLNFNYYHTENLDSAPYASFVLIKYF